MDEPITSSPSLDRVAIEQCGENQIRMRSQISELKSRTSKDLAVGSMSREWTNEKHSSYLNSMEASFVKRLHNHKYHSMDMHGQHSRLYNLRDTNMSLKSNARSNANDLEPSNKFKVLQSGYWNNVSFEPAQPKSNIGDESRVLLENQWVRHFRCADKRREVLSVMPKLPERGAQNSESIHSGGQKLEHCGAVDRQKAASYGARMHSKKLHADYAHQLDQDYVSSNTEVSDQNFIDEERAENHVRGKKTKTETSDVAITDQVVPLRKFSTAVDVNGSPELEVMNGGACPQ